MKPFQYCFRFNYGDLVSTEFYAARTTFRYILNRAFMRFIADNHLRAALLEVHHPVHGWQQVYNHLGICQRIDNPLLLDYSQLYEAAIYTWRCCDNWPTEEERQRKKEKLRRQERHEESLARRQAFYVVKKSD